MEVHSQRQRDILRKIGVEVWRVRGAEAEAEEDVAAETVGDAAATAAVPEAEVETPAAESPPDSPSTTKPPAAAPPPEPVEQTKPTEPPPPQTAPGDDSSLESIAREVAACQRCELHTTRSNTVFGVGHPGADWLFVGEAPGHHEDLQGEPFVGRAGKLLDKMIAALGMTREQVFIANVLKCRPPNNRDPLPGEVEQCEPYLHRQLALIRPKVIVALGRVSAQALLKSNAPLGKLRGQVHRYGADEIPLVATYHPAYLLRSPEQKSAAWEDLWQARMIARR